MNIYDNFQLYGGNCSTKMLSSFGKLFQAYLLYLGFTLGVKDILVTAVADKKRKEIMNECRKVRNRKKIRKIISPKEFPKKLLQPIFFGIKYLINI